MIVKPAILLVDDSRDMLELMRRQLKGNGYNPFVSDNVLDAIEILESTEIDLLITDMNMPGANGEQLVRFVSEHHNEIPILVITGFPDVNSAVHVMKLGALEYLIKPFTEDELMDSIQRVLPADKVLEDEKSSTDYSGEFTEIIGNSDGMQELYHTINRTSNNKATILISGESGTGKELVARAIHYNSRIASGPFVPVNCGAIPDQLIESELFGHIKGSFTGAISSRAGFFQAAHGGTLFLDEISNTSLDLQARLLRVIQDKEVTPLGSTKSQKVDVRIIAATNMNMQDLVSQGKFREDLFYRLNVISIEIPPLRDRGNDIVVLIKHFMNTFSIEMSKPLLKFEKGVLQTLQNYTWPGNVRELENFIHRVVIMSDSTLSMRDIPEYMKSRIETSNSDDIQLTLREVEKRHILKVLSHTSNNKSKAAEILGIDRKTLREKLK